MSPDSGTLYVPLLRDVAVAVLPLASTTVTVALASATPTATVPVIELAAAVVVDEPVELLELDPPPQAASHTAADAQSVSLKIPELLTFFNFASTRVSFWTGFAVCSPLRLVHGTSSPKTETTYVRMPVT